MRKGGREGGEAPAGDRACGEAGKDFGEVVAGGAGCGWSGREGGTLMSVMSPLQQRAGTLPEVAYRGQRCLGVPHPYPHTPFSGTAAAPSP